MKTTVLLLLLSASLMAQPHSKSPLFNGSEIGKHHGNGTFGTALKDNEVPADARPNIIGTDKGFINTDTKKQNAPHDYTWLYIAGTGIVCLTIGIVIGRNRHPAA